MASKPSHDSPIFFTTALFQRTKITVQGDIVQRVLPTKNCSKRVLSATPGIFVNNIRTQQSNGRHCSHRTMSDFVPPSRMTCFYRLRSAADGGSGGNCQRASSHRGQGRMRTTTRGMPSTRDEELVDRECCNDDNAMIMRATCDEEQRKQEDE
jgi:hypothetical protein